MVKVVVNDFQQEKGPLCDATSLGRHVVNQMGGCSCLTVGCRRAPRRIFAGPLKGFIAAVYRGTSLIRNNPLLGPNCRTMPRVLWWF